MKLLNSSLRVYSELLFVAQTNNASNRCVRTKQLAKHDDRITTAVDNLALDW